MKNFKIGVFGAGRGYDIAKNFKFLNCEIVALCDNRKDRMDATLEKLNDKSIKTYDDFDEFLECGMDAVVLANFFHEHAPYAIKCLERGIHVYSECISNGTMADGIKLLRAAEKSKAIYMLAENYPQMIFNQEMQQICKSGNLGKFLYAEGEYNHPGKAGDVTFAKQYNYFSNHWRNFVPRTYYVTHSLAPIMAATGANPKRVVALASYAPAPSDVPTMSRVGDKAANIMTQNDDGSVFRFTGCAVYGGHHNSYRICGTKGQIENLRGTDKVMLRFNSWSIPEGFEEINMYVPQREDKDEVFLKQSGHGGSDFITARMFLECLRENKQPPHPLDVTSAVNMSSVAILAHRSLLEGGTPYDIPDLTKEECIAQYENDTLSPFFSQNGDAPTMPCCSNPDYAPTEKQINDLLEKLK